MLLASCNVLIFTLIGTKCHYNILFFTLIIYLVLLVTNKYTRVYARQYFKIGRTQASEKSMTKGEDVLNITSTQTITGAKGISCSSMFIQKF